jgi:hypothetical protein
MNGSELLNRFSQVWISDFEYRCPNNERPDVHCVVAYELHTGKTLRFWRDDLRRLGKSPYPVGLGSLFISYNLSAEFSAHLSLGWELPYYSIDLLIEFRRETSGTDWREGEKSKHKLVHAMQYFNRNPMDAVEKSEMQALAMRGPPFSGEEKQALLSYCERDVVVTCSLLRAMAPRIDDGLAALQRGRYMRSFALAQHRGIPLDTEILKKLDAQKELIRERLIDSINAEYDVYRGTHFNHQRMEDFITKHHLPWPRLESGCACMKKEVWEVMAEEFPLVEPLHRCRQLIGRLRENNLGVGKDGRSRPTIFPMSTTSGRNTWASSEFVFALPTYLRGLIQPSRGRAISHLDYRSQEIAVAAALSDDSALKAAYASEDIYLAFGRQAGLIPLDATEKTHKTERKWLKACVLGLMYDITKFGLGHQLGLPTDYSQELIEAHQRTYPKFRCWKEAVVKRALLDGFQWTVLGWRTKIRDGFVRRKGKRVRLFNARSAVNNPVQGGAADVTRTACCLISEAGICLLTSVHDAVLIEADENEIESQTDLAERLMVEAGRQVLGDITLRVDRKIVRHPGRLLMDDKEEEKWDWLMAQLNKKDVAALQDQVCVGAT